MSGQQSNILINYHVPIVLSDAQNIPRSQAAVDVDQLVNQNRQQQQAALGRELTLTEAFHLEQELALKLLGQYPGTYAKQWLLGVLKTMNGPFITQLYDSLNIKPDRIRFADVLEQGFFPGLLYYLKNVDLFFLVNLLLTIAMAGFALVGNIAIMKSKDPFLWIMMLANCYFMFIPGPEGYPRFRFPIGLFWFLQASIGYYWLMAFWQRIPYSPCLYSKKYIESRTAS